ncbi:MAG TPA: zf-HC2 domain-containing protein [Candidatus Limnocylindrales bacterium]|jgi:anti-sigma factor RsiW|nr:zf-HC2 domain-containing protein [Candidatus Limnocylindrales bacterium]HZM11888.1 zf-HC2 domain-containing protein [Candidatus Limnocylindrales bacterium]
MNHSEALQLMATEKYLLDEFPPEIRDEFEEHFFGCPECALDVHMAATFLQHGKKALSAAEAKPIVAAPVKSGWAAWLRPAFAIPVFALLLAVIGYQAFVVRPTLSNTIAELEQPQILASAYLSAGTARGDSQPVVIAQAGQPYILFVDIPARNTFSAYSAELLNPAGTKLWSLKVPSETVESAKDSLPIRVAPASNEAGDYILVVRGIAAGETEGPEIARYLFKVQLR